MAVVFFRDDTGRAMEEDEAAQQGGVAGRPGGLEALLGLLVCVFVKSHVSRIKVTMIQSPRGRLMADEAGFA